MLRWSMSCIPPHYRRIQPTSLILQVTKIFIHSWCSTPSSIQSKFFLTKWHHKLKHKVLVWIRHGPRQRWECESKQKPCYRYKVSMSHWFLHPQNQGTDEQVFNLTWFTGWFVGWSRLTSILQIESLLTQSMTQLLAAFCISIKHFCAS